MSEQKPDFKKKIADLKYVKSQLVKLGSIITEVDSRHRQVILEPRFQAKVEKLIREAELLSEVGSRTSAWNLRKDQPLKPSEGQSNLASSSNIGGLTDLQSDLESNGPEKQQEEEIRPKTRKSHTRNEYVDNWRNTRSIGVDPMFSSVNYGSSSPDEFSSPIEKKRTYKRNEKPYRNHYFDSKFKEQKHRLARMENNFNLMTSKLNELLNSKYTDPKKAKKMQSEIRIWKGRADKICDIMDIQSIGGLDEYMPESKDSNIDELSFWKHRAHKLFDMLVKLKRADARVWKAAEPYIDFDEALDILTRSGRHGSCREEED